MCRKCFFLVFIFVLFSIDAPCQISIDTIIVKGNKHTRLKTILTESIIQPNQIIEIKDKDILLSKSINQLLSTGLFNSVHASIDTFDNKEILNYEIKENWYLYPVPLFELADRNFNVWWQEQNRDLSRTVYGVDISHYNLTGRRDPLGIKFQGGYTRKVELRYQLPLILGENWGIAGNVFYSDNKEIGYKTISNKTLFKKHPDETTLLKRRRMGLRFLNRPNVFTHHSFRIEYHHNSIDPYVLESLNEAYFFDNKTDNRFLFFEYDFQYDKRSYTLYPKSGYLLRANLKQEGFEIFKDYFNTSVNLRAEYYLALKEKIVFGFLGNIKGNITRQKVSFANNTGIGWGSTKLSGYDLYVIDGTDYLLLKNYVSYHLLEKTIKLFRFLPEQFRTLPLSIYMRFNFDTAYVNEETYVDTNSLSNRFIYGYGPALDMIFYNNFLFSFEYGFNDLGEHGLFLTNKISF